MRDKKALHITKDAKDNTFIDCDIEGVKNEGQGTLMIKSRIYNFRKKHPKLWIGIIVSFFITLGINVIVLFIEYGYFVK